LRDRIGQLEGLYNTLKEQVENCLTKAEFEAWKEDIKGQISNIIGNQQGNTNIAEILNGLHLTITTDCTKILNEKLAEIKKEIMEELLSSDSFTDDLKDILIDEYGFITADDVAGLSDALSKLTELETKLAGIEDYADRIKALEDEITKLAQLELEVATLKSTAITMDDLADYVKASDLATILSDYAKTSDLTGFASKDELNDLISSLNDYAKKTDLAGYATKDDLNNYATKDDIADFVTVGDLAAYAKTEDLALYAKLTDLNDYVKKSDFNSAKEELLDKIGANTTAINEVKDQIKDINDEITSIKDDVKDLQDRVKATEDKITELETKVDNIKKDVTAIQNKLAKQVTSIIVQGTRNPMFGTFSIPANIQSNILLAYYGVPVSDVEFPTSKTGLYGIRADEALTATEIALLKEMGLEIFETPASEPLLAENGNAGKVYMTINPNTADLSGLKLSIVNTLDKEAPIKLSAIRKSTDQLQFGYSRADNGFYEADAYVEPMTVKTGSNGIPLTKDEIKATFGDIKNKIKDILKSDEKGEMTIGDIATDVYTIVRDLKADQNGLKCTYTTTEADATETEHSVYSQYNLAATFLQPLNLDTGKDFNYKTIPGYERAEALFKNIAKTLKEKIHTAFVDLNSSDLIKSVLSLEIKEVKLVDLSDELIAKFQITIGDDVTIDGMTYHMQIPADSDIPVMLAKGLTVNGKPVNIPSDLLIDPDKPKVKYPTLVILDDVTSTTVPMKLVLPVTNDALEQYLWYDLENNEVEAVYNADDVLVLNTKNVFKFTETTSSYNVTPLSTPVVKVDNMIDLSSGTTPTLHLEFTYDLRKEMVDLWSTAQGAIADVNDMLADIRKIVDELNDTLDKINKYEGKINNEIDNVVENYLMKYLDKINTTIVDFVNSFNRRLQPFMIASTSKGLKRVSGVKDYPTKLTSDVTIYPTSKTMELIVPFARKHVAVTNVFKGAASAQGGDSDCKSKMTAANTGNDRLNKVIDGNIRKIDVTGLEKGYVYEFAYSVLDFDGNMSTHRYYIEIQ
jgi:peptidoglycan hydrolase CwlO-like protein